MPRNYKPKPKPKCSECGRPDAYVNDGVCPRCRQNQKRMLSRFTDWIAVREAESIGLMA